MKLAEHISPHNVEVDLQASSKDHLLQLLAERAARATGLEQETVFAAAQRREQLGSTGIGGGIAIPHTPVPGIARPFVTVVRLRKSLEFDAIDSEPVDIVCLVLTPAESGGSHLGILSMIARVLRTPETARKARLARSAAEFYAILDGAAEQIAR